MRILIAVLLGVLVCACNAVVTQMALFGPADEAGAPGLRNGVWTAAPDPKCPFDEAWPITAWPDCASRLVMKSGQWLELSKTDGKWSWSSNAVVLATGSPRIVQMFEPGATIPFSYAALAPTRSDEAGRITAFVSWPVACGPPPPTAPKGQTQRSGTEQPLPGLVMDKDNDDCTTTSKDALRAAAAASRQWSTDVGPLHWVRDGER